MINPRKTRTFILCLCKRTFSVRIPLILHVNKAGKKNPRPFTQRKVFSLKNNPKNYNNFGKKMSTETKMMGNVTTIFFFLPPASWLTHHNTGNSCRKSGKITCEASFVVFFKHDSWNSTDVKRPLKHESTGDAAQLPIAALSSPP